MIFADGGGVIRVWNGRAQALFGYPRDEAIGQSLDLIIPEHLRAAHWLYVAVAFSIVKDEAGAVLGAVATARPASLKSAG